jgi:anti-anti-sigma factor
MAIARASSAIHALDGFTSVAPDGTDVTSVRLSRLARPGPVFPDHALPERLAATVAAQVRCHADWTGRRRFRVADGFVEPQDGARLTTQPTFPCSEGWLVSVFGSARCIRDVPSRFGASIRPGYRVTVIRLAGELDLATGSEIQTKLECALDTGASAIVVDLSRVTFIDAFGLGLIIRAQKSAIERGATLGVAGVESRVAHVFALAGLGDLIHTLVDADEHRGDADGHR